MLLNLLLATWSSLFNAVFTHVDDALPRTFSPETMETNYRFVYLMFVV